MTLDENTKTFVIYIATLLAPIMQIYPFCQVQLRLLLVNKAFIKILLEYFNYIDIFLFDFAIKLFENTYMNKHAIKLIKSKQLLYRLISRLI